jgi:hypothetical protein
MECPVVAVCTTATYVRQRRDRRPLPADSLICDADILLPTNGRLVNMVKNRNGVTQLDW